MWMMLKRQELGRRKQESCSHVKCPHKGDALCTMEASSFDYFKLAKEKASHC